MWHNKGYGQVTTEESRKNVAIDYLTFGPENGEFLIRLIFDDHSEVTIECTAEETVVSKLPQNAAEAISIAMESEAVKFLNELYQRYVIEQKMYIDTDL